MVSRVATILVVFAVPMFLRPKLTVTVSVGSTTPLVQLSAARMKLLETMIGVRMGGPARALMRLVPLGVRGT